MGRGNVCTFGKYEGLYYADRDHLVFMYRLTEKRMEENIQKKWNPMIFRIVNE